MNPKLRKLVLSISAPGLVDPFAGLRVVEWTGNLTSL